MFLNLTPIECDMEMDKCWKKGKLSKRWRMLLKYSTVGIWIANYFGIQMVQNSSILEWSII